MGIPLKLRTVISLFGRSISYTILHFACRQLQPLFTSWNASRNESYCLQSFPVSVVRIHRLCSLTWIIIDSTPHIRCIIVCCEIFHNFSIWQSKSTSNVVRFGPCWRSCIFPIKLGLRPCDVNSKMIVIKWCTLFSNLTNLQGSVLNTGMWRKIPLESLDPAADLLV